MTPPYRLDGKTALVTGASRGLGRHFAETLAAAGASVGIAARSTDALDTLAKEIAAAGGTALPVAMDVTDATSVDAAVETIERELGPVAILVNNSGVAVTKPALELEEADWDFVLDTNLKGVWLVARAVGRRMAARGQGGKIVNIASIGARIVLGQLSAYCASKAGVEHLTRSLAVELARQDIQVNALAPGYILTDMNSEFFESEGGQRLIRQSVPQRRIGRPSDLDGALMLLVSEASDFMTGSTIVIDGGHSVA